MVLNHDLIHGAIHIASRGRSLRVEFHRQVEGAPGGDDAIKACEGLAAVLQFQGGIDDLVLLRLEGQCLVGSRRIAWGDRHRRGQRTVIDHLVGLALRREVVGGIALSADEQALQPEARACIHGLACTIIERARGHRQLCLDTTYGILHGVFEGHGERGGLYLVGGAAIHVVDHVVPVGLGIIDGRFDIIGSLQRRAHEVPEGSGIGVVGDLHFEALVIVGRHIHELQFRGIPAHADGTVGESDIGGITRIVALQTDG